MATSDSNVAQTGQSAENREGQMRTLPVFKIKSEVLVAELQDEITLEYSSRQTILRMRTEGVRQLIKTLCLDGATIGQLKKIVEHDDGTNVTILYYILNELSKAGMLYQSVYSDDVLLLSCIPTSEHYRPSLAMDGPTGPYVLSRFAICRLSDGQLVIESPASHARIVLHDPRTASFLVRLVAPFDLCNIDGPVAGISVSSLTAMLMLLLSAGIITRVDANGTTDEDRSTTLRQWELHDLLLHTRSRLGRHRNGYGGTFRFRGDIEPLPAVKPLTALEITQLYRPDIKELMESDRSFTQVLESRKSIRKFGHEPISVKQLGEFLFRAARVREVIETDCGEVSNRPYAGGGAIYELEIYPIIRSCQGLDEGLYHYCPQGHQMSKILSRTEHIEKLLNDAWRCSRLECEPQVLLIIAARFQRISWKYESMAYATILKDVGVLYQTMYLVATAMDLACSAIGGGDSDVFAKAAFVDYYAETSVGEFILGSKSD